jgi:hypothetical protein
MEEDRRKILMKLYVIDLFDEFWSESRSAWMFILFSVIY